MQLHTEENSERIFTAQDIFQHTIALMNEMQSNSSGYKEFYLGILNQVLAECLELENGLRVQEGLAPYKEAPYLESMDEQVPYHQQLILNVLPYGVGTLLFLGDDENPKATYFSSKYNENKMKYGVVTYELVIEDVY